MRFIALIRQFARELLAEIHNEQVPWAYRVPRTCAHRAARFQ